MNKESIQGPMNQRSDFIEAKQKCKRLHDEHTEIAGEGNRPMYTLTTSKNVRGPTVHEKMWCAVGVSVYTLRRLPGD